VGRVPSGGIGLARPLRLEVAGGVYHVIARGNERKAIFRDDTDREVYLDRLAACRERFGFKVYAHCLMGNHLHLAVERGSVALSRIMLALQSFYSQRFNRRHRRVGHLFQGRYKAFLIEREVYLFALLRYIHFNPVRVGLVRKPQDYRWSSARFYRAGKGPGWLDLEVVLRMLGPRPSLSVARYRQLMDGSARPIYEEAQAAASAVKGSDEFVELALTAVGEPAPVRKNWTIESLTRQVAEAEGLTVEDLRRPGPHLVPSRARSIAAYLGRTHARIPVARMARYFGRDESTLVRCVLRLETALARDAKLAAHVRHIARRIQDFGT